MKTRATIACLAAVLALGSVAQAAPQAPPELATMSTACSTELAARW